MSFKKLPATSTKPSTKVFNDKLGVKSRRCLSSAHNDWTKIINVVVERYNCSVLVGHRNKEDQNEAFAEGKSEKFWPNSQHNSLPSMAIDVAPYFQTIPHIRWGDKEGFYLFAGYVMGVASMLYETGEITHLVTNGSDWNNNRDTKDQTFMDLVHFQLREP